MFKGGKSHDIYKIERSIIGVWMGVIILFVWISKKGRVEKVKSSETVLRDLKYYFREGRSKIDSTECTNDVKPNSILCQSHVR